MRKQGWLHKLCWSPPGPLKPTSKRVQLEPHMKSLFVRFAKGQSGATAIEYGFIVVLISVICIAMLQQISARLNNNLTSNSNNLNCRARN